MLVLVNIIFLLYTLVVIISLTTYYFIVATSFNKEYSQTSIDAYFHDKKNEMKVLVESVISFFLAYIILDITSSSIVAFFAKLPANLITNSINYLLPNVIIVLSYFFLFTCVIFSFPLIIESVKLIFNKQKVKKELDKLEKK